MRDHRGVELASIGPEAVWIRYRCDMLVGLASVGLVPTEGCVIHHKEGNLDASEVGQAAKHYFSFDDAGRLSLATPPGQVSEGSKASIVFVWERL